MVEESSSQIEPHEPVIVEANFYEEGNYYSTGKLLIILNILGTLCSNNNIGQVTGHQRTLI